MGLFHIAFSLFGWICGSSVHKIIGTFDHWIAFGVLAFLGIKMIYESFSSEENDSKAISLALRNTLLLCVAHSIDALATGFSLSMQTISIGIIWAAVIIGISASVISAAGIKLGYYFSSKLGSKTQVLGGVILIVIGGRILLEHLM
jgi:putative Mn2+ efflux pump MntP